MAWHGLVGMGWVGFGVASTQCWMLRLYQEAKKAMKEDTGEAEGALRAKRADFMKACRKRDSAVSKAKQAVENAVMAEQRYQIVLTDRRKQKRRRKAATRKRKPSLTATFHDHAQRVLKTLGITHRGLVRRVCVCASVRLCVCGCVRSSATASWWCCRGGMGVKTLFLCALCCCCCVMPVQRQAVRNPSMRTA